MTTSLPTARLGRTDMLTRAGFGAAAPASLAAPHSQ